MKRNIVGLQFEKTRNPPFVYRDSLFPGTLWRNRLQPYTSTTGENHLTHPSSVQTAFPLKPCECFCQYISVTGIAPRYTLTTPSTQTNFHTHTQTHSFPVFLCLKLFVFLFFSFCLCTDITWTQPPLHILIRFVHIFTFLF